MRLIFNRLDGTMITYNDCNVVPRVGDRVRFKLKDLAITQVWKIIDIIFEIPESTFHDCEVVHITVIKED